MSGNTDLVVGRLMPAKAAAAFRGVPDTSLRAWALAGKVPFVRAPGARRMRFDRRDLERVIERWKERHGVWNYGPRPARRGPCSEPSSRAACGLRRGTTRRNHGEPRDTAVTC